MNRFCPKSKSTLILPVTLMILLAACAHKVIVEIPPRIQLGPDQVIGIVEFSSNSTDQLNRMATQRFMNAIQNAQPGVRFLELGPDQEVLKAVGLERIDPPAIKAIGLKYGVDSIFSGSYEVSEMKPRIHLGGDLSSVHASAVVNISMAARHWDANSGATLWTNSRYGEWPLASVNKESGKSISLSMSMPEDKYGHFISKLVFAVTDDFRPHYEKRKVTKK